MRNSALSAIGRALVVLAFALLPLQAWGQTPKAPTAPAQKAQDAPRGHGAPGMRHPALVRLAFGSGWDGLPAIVGIERGFFDQQNIVVSGLPTASAKALANSLVAGSTDFAAIPQRFFIALAAAKLPVKAVAVGVSGTHFELVAKPGSGIKSITDLKGKTIGLSRSSESLPVLMRLLNAAKIAPKDVKTELMSPSGVETALEKGKADAIFETQHYTAPLIQKKKAVAIMTPEDVVKSIGVIDAMPLITTNAMIQKQPKLVERFVRGWIAALHYIQQDPKDAARLLQIFLHRQGITVQPQTAEAWVGMADYDRYEWTPPLVADAEYNAWGLQQAKVLKDAPKLAPFIDNSFAEKATQALASK